MFEYKRTIVNGVIVDEKTIKVKKNLLMSRKLSIPKRKLNDKLFIEKNFLPIIYKTLIFMYKSLMKLFTIFYLLVSTFSLKCFINKFSSNFNKLFQVINH